MAQWANPEEDVVSAGARGQASSGFRLPVVFDVVRRALNGEYKDLFYKAIANKTVWY